MAKPTVYFAGSITGGRDDAALYATIITMVSEFGTVLTEHIGSSSLTNQGEVTKTSQYIHDRDMQWLAEADAVVAEVSTPSLGVGYELGYVETHHKPIMCLWRKNDKKLSNMIKGAPHLGKNIVEYSEDDLPGLRDTLQAFFENLNHAA